MERREASTGTLRECRIRILGIFRRLTEVGRGIGDSNDAGDFGNLGETIDKRENAVVECTILRIKQIYTQLFESDF